VSETPELPDERPVADSDAQMKYSGWFPDPLGQAPLRFYDGSQWTDQIMQRYVEKKNGFSQFFSSTDWTSEAIDIHGHSLNKKISYGDQGIEPFKIAYLLPFVAGCFLSLFLLMKDSESTLSSDEQVTNSPFWLWLVLAAVFVGSFLMFRNFWKKYTAVKDTPTVEIRGAHIGMCELQGVVEPYQVPVASWTSNRLCVFTRTTIEERVRGSKNETRWEERWKRSDGVPLFYLRDTNGDRILVDASDYPPENWLPTLSSENYLSSRRYTERGLLVGQKIFIMGSVQVTPDGNLVVAKHAYPSNHVERSSHFIVQPGDEEHVLAGYKKSFVATSVQFFALMALTAFLIAFKVTMNQNLSVLISAVLTVLLGGGLGVLMWLAKTWNRLQAAKWRIGAAWSLIAVAAQRRHDLLPSLQRVTQEAFVYESTTQQTLAALRIPNANEIADVEKDLNESEPIIQRFVALQESTPDLRAGEATTKLMNEIVSSENQLASTRKFYNDAVTVASTMKAQFPTSLLAGAVLSELPALLNDAKLDDGN
jgi:LemA protein